MSTVNVKIKLQRSSQGVIEYNLGDIPHENFVAVATSLSGALVSLAAVTAKVSAEATSTGTNFMSSHTGKVNVKGTLEADYGAEGSFKSELEYKGVSEEVANAVSAIIANALNLIKP